MKPPCEANCVTEFTVMVCGLAAGQLWWKLSSSAAEAMIGTSLFQAYSIAARAKEVLFTVPSASCTMCAPLSTAKTTPCAKLLESAMKLSPTRIGRTRQFGHVPRSPPLSASAVESSASPVPCPYDTSSNGSLSSSRKFQPAMSST